MVRAKDTAAFLAQQNEEFLIQGATLSRNNAYKHFDAAETLLQAGCIGLAISHFVLSIEESIKAHVLMTSAVKPSEDLRKLVEAFSSHSAKHRAASGFMASSALLAPIAVQLAKRKTEVSEPASSPTDVLTVWGRKLDFRSITVPLDLEWWKRASSIKEQGFYIDVDCGRSSWLTPESIPEWEVRKARDIAKSVLERIELMFAVPLDILKSAAGTEKCT